MSFLKLNMNNTNVLLPTKRGSVIGWSVYANNECFFCCAVLDYGDDRETLVWHVAGTNKVFTSEEITLFAKDWDTLGSMEDTRPIQLKRFGKYEKELLAQIEALEDEITTESNLINWKERQSPKMSVSSNKRKLNRLNKKLNMLRTDLEELIRTGL